MIDFKYANADGVKPLTHKQAADKMSQLMDENLQHPDCEQNSKQLQREAEQKEAGLPPLDPRKSNISARKRDLSVKVRRFGQGRLTVCSSAGHSGSFYFGAWLSIKAKTSFSDIQDYQLRCNCGSLAGRAGVWALSQD